MSKSWLRTYQDKVYFGELFDSPDAVKLTRSENPSTSKQAANLVSQFGKGHQRKIYETLKSMTNGTFYEIAEVSKMQPSSVWRRLNELEKKNLIATTGEERPGPTGRMCRVWKVI